MPSPLLFSLITMIGRNAASAAFDFDFRSPRHSARKPPTEFAPPTSTPNSVRWTASLVSDPVAAGASSAAGGAEATTSGVAGRWRPRVRIWLGLASVLASILGGALDSISFPAAGSGGAIIDFEAINGQALPASASVRLPPLPLANGRCLRHRCTVAGPGLRRRGNRAAAFPPWPQLLAAAAVGGGAAGVRTAVATGDMAGAGRLLLAPRPAPPPRERPRWWAQRRLRRSCGCSLPRDRAGHRIQPLFQHGDARVQPVAIAVQRVDGGGQPSGLVLAFLGDRLDLLRLPRQIGGRDLFAPRCRSRTGWRASPR